MYGLTIFSAGSGPERFRRAAEIAARAEHAGFDSVWTRIHGNLGYSTEFPLQQRFRDVMAYLVADGTAEIQKMVIARDLLARHTVRR